MAWSMYYSCHLVNVTPLSLWYHQMESIEDTQLSVPHNKRNSFCIKFVLAIAELIPQLAAFSVTMVTCIVATDIMYLLGSFALHSI